MADFDVHLDEENELRFNVTTEGTDATASVTSRMVVESGHMDLMFQGTALPGGEISVVVPSLKGVLAEGSYSTRLEVLVDDRIFTPLHLSANFKQSIKVVAEAAVSRHRASPSVRANVIRVGSQKSSKKSSPLHSSSDKKTNASARNEELRSLLRRVIKKQD